MFKKYKQLFIGVLLGGLIFGAVPTLAANKTITAVVDDIKVKINGTEVKTDTPIIYNNKTYIPIRPVAEKLGANVAWDGETKTVDINTASQTVVSKKPASTPDGITAIIEYEGKYYISPTPLRNKLKERGYIMSKGINTWSITKDGKIILDNINLPEIFGSSRMEYDYYVNNIIPITQ